MAVGGDSITLVPWSPVNDQDTLKDRLHRSVREATRCLRHFLGFDNFRFGVIEVPFQYNRRVPFGYIKRLKDLTSLNGFSLILSWRQISPRVFQLLPQL